MRADTDYSSRGDYQVRQTTYRTFFSLFQWRAAYGTVESDIKWLARGQNVADEDVGQVIADIEQAEIDRIYIQLDSISTSELNSQHNDYDDPGGVKTRIQTYDAYFLQHASRK